MRGGGIPFSIDQCFPREWEAAVALVAMSFAGNLGGEEDEGRSVEAELATTWAVRLARSMVIVFNFFWAGWMDGRLVGWLVVRVEGGGIRRFYTGWDKESMLFATGWDMRVWGIERNGF